MCREYVLKCEGRAHAMFENTSHYTMIFDKLIDLVHMHRVFCSVFLFWRRIGNPVSLVSLQALYTSFFNAQNARAASHPGYPAPVKLNQGTTTSKSEEATQRRQESRPNSKVPHNHALMVMPDRRSLTLSRLSRPQPGPETRPYEAPARRMPRPPLLSSHHSHTLLCSSQTSNGFSGASLPTCA